MHALVNLSLIHSRTRLVSCGVVTFQHKLYAAVYLLERVFLSSPAIQLIVQLLTVLRKLHHPDPEEY